MNSAHAIVDLNKALKVGSGCLAGEVTVRSEKSAFLALFDTLGDQKISPHVQKLGEQLLSSCDSSDPLMCQSIPRFDERLCKRYGPSDCEGKIAFVGCDVTNKMRAKLVWSDGAVAYLFRKGKLVDSLAAVVVPGIHRHLGGRGMQGGELNLGRATWHLQPKDRVFLSTATITNWINIEELVKLVGDGPCGVAASSICTIASLRAGRSLPVLIFEYCDVEEEEEDLEELTFDEDDGLVDVLAGLEGVLESLVPKESTPDRQQATEPVLEERQVVPEAVKEVHYSPPVRVSAKPAPKKKVELPKPIHQVSIPPAPKDAQSVSPSSQAPAGRHNRSNNRPAVSIDEFSPSFNAHLLQAVPLGTPAPVEAPSAEPSKPAEPLEAAVAPSVQTAPAVPAWVVGLVVVVIVLMIVVVAALAL